MNSISYVAIAVANELRRHGLTDSELFLTSNRADEVMGVPGARHTPSSDVDIVALEPEGWNLQQLRVVEEAVREATDKNGADFNFVPRIMLERGEAYGRVVVRIKSTG